MKLIFLYILNKNSLNYYHLKLSELSESEIKYFSKYDKNKKGEGGGGLVGLPKLKSVFKKDW